MILLISYDNYRKQIKGYLKFETVLYSHDWFEDKRYGHVNWCIPNGCMLPSDKASYVVYTTKK